MDKINIIGGGPAGLYFAIIMRELKPQVEINVFERNSADDVAGWGIVLNLGTLSLLKKCDPASYEEIINRSQHWSDVDIFHRQQKISVRGKEYISISRKMLILALRERCEQLGVNISFNQKISKPDEVNDCDLLVGADGAHSIVRSAHQQCFKPTIDIRKNKYIWLGTKRLFKTITHIFKVVPAGIFTAEAYVYSETHSTFIATCDQDTWSQAGLSEMSNEETLDYLSEVFKEELQGQRLLGGHSMKWHNFPIIKNENWICPKVILLGDALHTAHFSIGSGTRLALEDAILAARCISEQEDHEKAMRKFERTRRPFLEKYQDIAFESLSWFENIEQDIDLDLLPFAFKVMTRSSQLGIRSLKLQDPEFVEQYLQYQAAAEASS